MAVLKKTSMVIYLGETFRYRFAYKNPDGTPVNLTGCSARMHVRSDIDSATVLLDLTTGNGKLVITGGSGLVDIAVPESDMNTSSITWEEGVFDIEVVFPDTTVDKLAYGTVKVIKEVTR